ncbi:MAG: hypothetical protein ACE5OW_03225 [Candidatus Bathyarchaeia archaeon]
MAEKRKEVLDHLDRHVEAEFNRTRNETKPNLTCRMNSTRFGGSTIA